MSRDQIHCQAPTKDKQCLSLAPFDAQDKLKRLSGLSILAHLYVTDGGAEVKVRQSVKKLRIVLVEFNGQVCTLQLLGCLYDEKN